MFVYSRAGYGQSSPSKLPRPVTFMHEEARDVLPRVLDAIGFRRGLLVGHSDGASIATIYAGSVQDHRVRGLVLMAPHFFTEDMGIAEIARAKEAFETGPSAGEARALHADVDNAFHNWNGPWLDPEFRNWDITDALAYIRVPILIVQGENDQYGTVRQIEVAQRGMLLPGRGRDAAGYAACAAPRGAGGDAARDRRLRQPPAARPPRRRLVAAPNPGLPAFGRYKPLKSETSDVIEETLWLMQSAS